ncbi:DNA polymerase III subunit tau, partial [termite gut metagenome]
MENYMVSARKYRPSTFESVMGQKSLTVTLKNAIASHKLAHAYLFCGPRGVGKTTCARIFAKTINCLSLTEQGEACNVCESCVSFNEQRSYNIHELDAASNNSVDDIRSLTEQVRVPPQVGKYKVYIIDEVHMLSSSAFNAFLKTLEEPPAHAVFILATTEKYKILPTILSRCQIYDFNRITVEDMVSYLMYVASKERITAEAEALNVIALKADGGMRDALSIFDQVVSFTGGNVTYEGVIENLNVLDYEYYFRLTDYFLENKVSEVLLLFNEVLNKGFEGGYFITGLSSHFRDMLVSKDPITLPLLEVGASIRERYRTQAQRCPLPFLYHAIKLCNDCDMNYRTSSNKRLLIELTLIQLAQSTASGEDTPGSGRSPKQEIKPIFTLLTPVTEQPETIVPNSAAPQESVLPVKGGKEKTIPSMKELQTGFSIKRIQKDSEKEPPLQEEWTGVSEENQKFDENELNLYWQEYAKQLPLERKAIAMRMQ